MFARLLRVGEGGEGRGVWWDKFQGESKVDSGGERAMSGRRVTRAPEHLDCCPCCRCPLPLPLLPSPMAYRAAACPAHCQPRPPLFSRTSGASTHQPTLTTLTHPLSVPRATPIAPLPSCYRNDVASAAIVCLAAACLTNYSPHQCRRSCRRSNYANGRGRACLQDC